MASTSVDTYISVLHLGTYAALTAEPQMNTECVLVSGAEEMCAEGK